MDHSSDLLFFFHFLILQNLLIELFVLLMVKQAMTICTQQELQCTLYMDLAFVLSQEEMSTKHSVTSQYCIGEALAIKETKKMYVIFLKSGDKVGC